MSSKREWKEHWTEGYKNESYLGSTCELATGHTLEVKPLYWKKRTVYEAFVWRPDKRLATRSYKHHRSVDAAKAACLVALLELKARIIKEAERDVAELRKAIASVPR